MASWLDAYPVVEEPVEESSDYKSRLIKKILSGAEDYTYGPGSPTPTPSDMRQRIGSRDNRLVTGDVALPPRDYGLFTPEEREQYRIADTSWFTPGRPTPRGSVERYYGAGRSEDISWLNDYPVAEESAAVEEPSGDTSWLDKYPVAEEPPKPQGPTAEEAGGITVAGQYVPEEQVPAAKAVLGGLENLQFVQRNLLDPIKQVAELKHAAAEAPPQTAEEYDLLYYKTGKTKSEREELNRPLHEAMQVPLVSPETIATGLRGISSIGAMRPEDLEQGPIEKGTTGEVAKMLSGLTTGEGAAALPAYMFPPTAVGLTAGDVQDLPADVTETIQKLQQGDKEGAAAAATRALMKTAMSGAVIKGAGAVSGPKSLPEAMTRLEADKLRTAVKGPEAPTEVISETARPTPAVEPTTVEEIYAQQEPSPARVPSAEHARAAETRLTTKAPPEAQAAVAPEPYTREAAEARAAQPKAEPVAEPGKAGTGEGGISIKNEYTEAQRQALGFPEAVQEARRDFGTVWEEAEATDRRDPGAGARLVDAINEGKVKALDDHGDALLLREQIRAQGEHTDAVKAVNEAATDADRTAAKARLEIARDELQAVYDADKRAGRETARGLSARQMLAKEDYSLTAMEARKRAANNGERLNERQLKEVETLHARITELSDRIDQLQASRSGKADFNRLIQEGKKEAARAAASRKSFTEFTGEKAANARARIAQRRAEGRLYSGVDPVAVADQVIIGADYIARGATKFADWSAHMVKEFGDRIKPFLKDLWDKARAYHQGSSKAYRTPEQVRLERYKTGLAKQTVGVKAKIQRGDFTKAQRQPLALDPAAFKMKANLQRLKNEFERGVAKDAYRKMGKADRFWQHFVGVERAMKLSSPAVFEKLGLAAAVREVLSPLETAGGYAVSKAFPRLAKGTRYGAGLRTITRAEIKAKASLFTKGMKDAWENLKGKETELEAISDKYGRQPDFWYNRIGKIHAAVKAPVKRAEFVRSLEHRMDAAVKAGEDINHPQVMDRLATESAMDANRAIFQQNTVVSKFFAMADKLSPAGGRAARFLFPVVKIPVNLFKELVTYNVGGPVAAAKIGRAYWKGVETLEPAAREAIIRQLTKGSVGGAAILWGYFNSDKVHDFFASVPPWFQHTPIAMAIHEGSIIGEIKEGSKEAGKDLQKMAKYDIPFMYTVTGLTDALNPRNPHGWRDYIYSMIQSTTVPQVSSWAAKELDKPTPFSLTDKPAFRQPTNIVEAVTQGIPGLRGQVPFGKGQGPKSIEAMMRERMLTR